MPRKPTQPTYRLHKPRNLAVVTIDGKNHYLGPWQSPESHEKYATLIAEWKRLGSKESLEAKARLELEIVTSPTRSLETVANITVAEVLAVYLDYAEKYYAAADGTPSKEVDSIKRSIRPVRVLYASLPAAEFSPLKLKAVRQSMIDANHCRKQINKRIDRVRRAFRWAAGEELVPTAVYEGLRAVPPLMPGRGGIKEGKPRKPADPEAVAKALPFMPPAVRVVVQLLRLTGARPTEILTMRPCDLDRKNEIWAFTPATHKTAWKGKTRTIYIGKDAQAALAPWLLGTPNDGYVFSPARSEELRNRERSEKRKTPLYPSHAKRNASKRVKLRREPFAPRFDHQSLAYAVRRACEKAEVEPFSPYCLRHLRAVELREKYGLEVVRAVLGQSQMSMADLYSKGADEVLARKAAAEVG